MNAYSQPNSTFSNVDYVNGAIRFKRAIAEVNKRMAEAQFISDAIKDRRLAAISPLTALPARAAGQVAFFKTYGVKATAKSWVKP